MALVERLMKAGIAIGFRRWISEFRGSARPLLPLRGDAILITARGFRRRLLRLSRRLIDERPPFAIERGREAG